MFVKVYSRQIPRIDEVLNQRFGNYFNGGISRTKIPGLARGLQALATAWSTTFEVVVIEDNKGFYFTVTGDGIGTDRPIDMTIVDSNEETIYAYVSLNLEPNRPIT